MTATVKDHDALQMRYWFHNAEWLEHNHSCGLCFQEVLAGLEGPNANCPYGNSLWDVKEAIWAHAVMLGLERTAPRP